MILANHPRCGFSGSDLVIKDLALLPFPASRVKSVNTLRTTVVGGLKNPKQQWRSRAGRRAVAAALMSSFPKPPILAGGGDAYVSVAAPAAAH